MNNNITYPSNWEIKNFDNCILNKRVKVGKVKQKEFLDNGIYPIVDQSQKLIAGFWNNVEDVYQDQLPVIIFGDHTRTFKYVDFKFVAGADGTKVILPNKDNVDPKYFYFILLTLNITNRGYNRHYSLLKNKQIPLPPLPEQKKIAAVLSAVQEAKEKTEAVIEATKTLKKSMMKHLFTYGPVSVKEADKVDVVNFEVGEIPSSWETAKIEEYYNFSRKPKNIDILANKELPFIPMEGISNNSKSCSWIKKIKSDISSGTFVFKNDLIVAKITPSFENGKQSILYNLPDEYGYATTEVWALHSKDGSSLNEYLYEYLKLPTVRKEIAGKMEGSTGRQRVSRGVISNTMFPKPTLKEQKNMVNILDKIDTKIQSEENKKQALEKLFQSLLKNLMTGKQRVNNIDIPL